MKNLKDIRKALSTKGTQFTVFGQAWGKLPKTFTVAESITKDASGYYSGYITSGVNQMNVDYIGNSKMDLYTFNMLGIRSNGTIHFKDVKILEK